VALALHDDVAVAPEQLHEVIVLPAARKQHQPLVR
jgi:hypothetical protein